ncbi:hypothetical protein GF352_04240 [archaeon]|nr:hypothetical protein [archaeon]
MNDYLNELIICDDASDVELNNWGIYTEKSCTDASLISMKWIDLLWHISNGLHTHLNAKVSYVPNKSRRERKNSCNGCNNEVFAPIINGEKEDLVIAVDDKVLKDKLFSGKVEKHVLTTELAVTVANYHSVGVRCVEQEVFDLMKNTQLPHNAWFNIMPCLVSAVTKYPLELSTIYAEVSDDVKKDYFQLIDRTPVSHLSAMLSSMQSSIKAYVAEAQANGIKEVLVYPFINQGPLAGATQPRLHAQAYIELTQSGHDISYEGLLLSFHNKPCHLCSSTHGDRVLYENDYWSIWLTSAPMRDFQLRFAPKNHVERFIDLTKPQVEGLADVLKIGNKVLSRLGVTNHRNIVFRTLHSGYETEFHFFGEVLPYQSGGGFEEAGEIRVAYVNPSEAAIQTREALKNLHDNGFDTNDYNYKQKE